MRISDSELKKLLIGSAKVKEAAFIEAEKQHDQTKKSLLQTIYDRKLITEKELTKLYAQDVKIPFVELSSLKIPREVLTKIPERIARKYQVVMYGHQAQKWQLAMADPGDVQAVDFIEKEAGGSLEIAIATTSDILAVIDQYKGSLDNEITKAIKDSSTDDEKDDSAGIVTAKDLAEDAPIAKTVNIIIEYAIKSRASDIHLEPRENIVQVRFRVDGVLRESMTLPRPILNAVVSRIKILANLKIDEHRVPQDGRFKFTLGSKVVALRVSTLPIMDGEKVVMRLLDESTRAQTMEELGFEGHALETIQRNLKKPHGMTLVTGPTGSGKSTTLYSVLNQMNTPGVNISTVEDPVEYRISGVNQTQVNVKAGMTFAGGLRALLRQDPNIIMVGEIRDQETADLAVQAALTGHVVLSTLHTNNAATTLPRLLDMKIEPFLIASTVNTVVGQRLVRKLCQVCKVQYRPEGKEVDDLKADFHVDEVLKLYDAHKLPTVAVKPELKVELAKAAPADILEKIKTDPNIIDTVAAPKIEDKNHEVMTDRAPNINHESPATNLEAPNPGIGSKTGDFVLYKAGAGCDECGHSGYQGRIGIYEVLEVNEVLGKMITGHATADEIQLAAIKNGMLTMQQDGFLKSLYGLTTVAEILRVTRE